jgi:hypothetical protein
MSLKIKTVIIIFAEQLIYRKKCTKKAGNECLISRVNGL